MITNSLEDTDKTFSIEHLHALDEALDQLEDNKKHFEGAKDTPLEELICGKCGGVMAQDGDHDCIKELKQRIDLQDAMHRALNARQANMNELYSPLDQELKLVEMRQKREIKQRRKIVKRMRKEKQNSD